MSRALILLSFSLQNCRNSGSALALRVGLDLPVDECSLTTHYNSAQVNNSFRLALERRDTLQIVVTFIIPEFFGTNVRELVSTGEGRGVSGCQLVVVLISHTRSQAALRLGPAHRVPRPAPRLEDVGEGVGGAGPHLATAGGGGDDLTAELSL